MKQGRQIAKRLGAMLLSIAIVLPLFQCMVGHSGDAEAAVSLPRVEELKDGGVINILELAPSAEQGSLGYFVAGQEPCAAWAETAASKVGAARKTYVDGLLGSLKTAGLLGDTAAADTPLYKTADYSEIMPSAYNSLTDTEKREYTALPLDAVESTGQTLTGTFTYSENGEYNLLSNGVTLKNANGGHIAVVQMVDYVVFYPEKPADGVSGYWYSPEFAKVDKTNVADGTAIYQKIDNAGGSNDYFTYAGTTGEDAFSFGSGDYYYIVKMNAPSASWSDRNKEYFAVSQGFRLAVSGEEAEFSVQKKQMFFEYVGTGGNASYSAAGNDQTATISTSLVYYKGGFANNNWFLRYVMDWETTETKPSTSIRVTTVAAKDVTPELVANASLIYISSGYALSGIAESYTASNDISGSAETAADTVYKAIWEHCSPEDGKPIMIDGAVVSDAGAANLKKLARALLAKKEDIQPDSVQTAPRVKDNVYCAPAFLGTPSLFKADVGETNYRVAMPPDTDISNLPYYPVYLSITLANQTRATAGVAPLSTTVTIANTIRHLLNGNITKGASKNISVLSVEPGKSTYLTKDAVKSWLGLSNEYSVDIKYVSTAELVGMTEDVCEKYDLIYIGSCIDDFSKKTNANGDIIRDYYDDSMDGMVYSNIGDLVVSGGESGWSLSGLLDRDFENIALWGNVIDTIDWTSPFSATEHDRARTFRYSGNDLTAKKLKEIKDYADAGFPVVYASDLAGDWFEISGDAESAKANSALGITVNCSFAVVIESAAEKTNTITARLEKRSGWGTVTQATYQWYKNGTAIKDASGTITGENGSCSIVLSEMPKENESYLCKVVATKGVLTGAIEHSLNSETATSETVTYHENAFGARVDNSSNMYELLNGIKTNANVKSSDSIGYGSLRAAVFGAAHPVLSLESKPTEYSMDADGVITSMQPGSDGKYSLEYTFKINWRIDPESGSPKYEVKLYLDENGDGLFSAEEQLTDAVLTDSNGGAVTNGQLNGKTAYKLSAKLPAGAAGILPWRMTIVNSQSGKDGLRCSAQGYTHITPKIRPTIDVLQINTSRTTKSWFLLTQTDETEVEGLNLQANIANGGTFATLKNQVTDFDVNMVTVKANELDGLASKYAKYCTAEEAITVAAGDNAALAEVIHKRKLADKEFTLNGSAADKSAELLKLLDSFDMLMMGFDDCYQEISAGAAVSIRSFISSGKATLFSHDNTSFFFLPEMDYHTDCGTAMGFDEYRRLVYANSGLLTQGDTWWKSNYAAFGYNFNMTIRDAVGLDRYGVTNETYGRTSFTNGGTSGIVASEDYLSILSDANKAKAESLVTSGYSIAYKPGSGREATVGETQGLTNGILTRHYKSGGYPTADSYNSSDYQMTTEITQLNKGQITTYPFDVNTAEFGGTADVAEGQATKTISISETHVQYDQLNMNSDDIVVWYCLAGGDFDYMPNDAVNSYYIYNRRNVTYTGFGHTTPGSEEKEFNLNEAKLLFNTIIAAYRSAETAISFTNANGDDLESFLIPSDGEDLLTSDYTGDPNRRIYLKIGKDSATDGMAISCYWGESNLIDTVKVYDAQTDQEIDPETTSYTAGKLYYIRLDDLIKKLPAGGIPADGLKLTAALGPTAGDGGVTSVGSDYLFLRKLSLFNLS